MASEGTIDWHQPYVWAVGACLEVAYACELSWSGRDEEWTASSVSVQVAQAIPVEDMSRALGDVLYLARRILKNFAKANKSRNELRVSFSNVLDVNAHEVEASLTWYQQLEQVFTAPEWRRSGVCEAYEGCLSELSHLASMHFSQSGRHRFAVFLGGECARYHLARGEYESASRLLRSLARQTEEDGWWSIFGACVRSICRAELALGRSTQAVAACFSMLQLAQEENVGVSKEEMEELMHTLVASLGKNAAKSEDHCAEEDDQMTDSVAKMNMDELFKPTVAVETTQTSESALQHGDIRVTLGITNEFPAGVHLEKVRVRFERVIVPEEMPNHEMPQEERSLNPPREHNSSAHLDELISAEAAAPDVSGNDDNESAMVDVPLMNLPTSNDNEVANIVESSDNVDKAVPHSGDHERVTEVLLEESNVHLDEKTGINLVFLHSGVPVGQYICTGIECILAGSTFQLLPPSSLATASFEIAARESTVQVLIDGAPLLIPTPSSDMETVSVSIQANDDTVSNGTLELRVFKRLSRRKHDACLPQDDEEEGEGESESGGEEESGIQIIGASLRGQEKMIIIPDNQTEPPEGFCKTFTVALPTLHRGSVLTYDLSLVVQPIDQLNHSNSDREDTFADDNSVTIMANVRYQRDGVTGNSSVPLATTEIRCAEAQFRVLQPLTESIRLKRVGSRIFVAVALACNDSIPVILQDYQLVCSEQGNGGAEEDPPLMVEQDPNTKLRGTRLRPRDCVHLAFTLASSPRFDTESGISFCTLQLHLQYGSDGTWQKTMSVRVPLAEVEGKRYRIDVLPRGQHSEHRFSGEMVEATSSEPVTFQVHVQEEKPQPNKAVLENDKNMMVLCLNESSERDWILVGKHLERFSLSHPVGGSRRRGFTTQKRLLATRTGQLRFPSFQLEVNGQIVPAARVHYQQGSRRVIVS
ncbi:unnamed protein product [Phytophthora lilii]|uniref:Unnamed protein product n=1 Tax=Phytophthora lilii TaxID=2077276 RepID=A0A9W6TXZ9_9STRA|nr:unnamed protein product [Phytophthora lilii]